MCKLDIDIENALSILGVNVSLNTDFNRMSEYSRIYKNTTENVREYMRCFTSPNSSALIPTASGDQVVESILNGFSFITCFDINRLAKYYVSLKLCAIEYLSKEDYIKFMYKDGFNTDIFNSIKKYLDSDVRSFWEDLYKKASGRRIDFFMFRCFSSNNGLYNGNSFNLYCANNYSSLLIDDNYNKIKEMLSNVNIHYIDSDFIFLSSVLSSKYDFINLSNIYQYFHFDIFSRNDRCFTDEVKKIISNNLEENGNILISYTYRSGFDDLVNNKHKSIFYAKVLNFINSSILLRKIYELSSNNKDLDIMLSDFRKFQLLRWFDDIDIDSFEVNEYGLSDRDSCKDLVLVYKNKHL